jgi:hypothetical protein
LHSLPLILLCNHALKCSYPICFDTFNTLYARARAPPTSDISTKRAWSWYPDSAVADKIETRALGLNLHIDSAISSNAVITNRVSLNLTFTKFSLPKVQ